MIYVLSLFALGPIVLEYRHTLRRSSYTSDYILMTGNTNAFSGYLTWLILLVGYVCSTSKLCPLGPLRHCIYWMLHYNTTSGSLSTISGWTKVKFWRCGRWVMSGLTLFWMGVAMWGTTSTVSDMAWPDKVSRLITTLLTWWFNCHCVPKDKNVISPYSDIVVLECWLGLGRSRTHVALAVVRLPPLAMVATAVLRRYNYTVLCWLKGHQQRCCVDWGRVSTSDGMTR